MGEETRNLRCASELICDLLRRAPRTLQWKHEERAGKASSFGSVLKTVENMMDRPPVNTKTAHFCRQILKRWSLKTEV